MALNKHVINCPSDPTNPPTSIGQHWTNTTTGDQWFSNGTASVANWIKLEGDTDIKVKVSLNDTTAGFLNGKLVAGSNIILTEQNDGGNETLEIAAAGPATDENVKVSSNDTTAGKLIDKLQAGTNIILTENNDGRNETFTIAATGSLSGELPSLQISRSAALDITGTSYVDVTFDVKDEENDSSVVEYDVVNTDRVKLKEAGLYIAFVDGQGYTATTRIIEGRLRLNDAVVVPGSDFTHRDASGGANGYEYRLGKIVIFSASANDFLSLQVKVNTATSAGDAQYRQGCLKVFKLQGAKGNDGATGATGSGSNVIVKEGNSSVLNTPHSELDFDANDFNLTDQGSGRVLIQATAGGDARKLFYADQFDNPINSDWVINALAPAIKDPSNNALTVRAFDDSAEEGVGFILSIPSGATQMKLSFKSRAKTAPTGGAKEVALNLYTREIPDNAAVGSWSGENNINSVISLPVSSTDFQYDEHTFTLASMANVLTAGRLYQFELTRDHDAASDTLVDDWYLLELIVEFI